MAGKKSVQDQLQQSGFGAVTGVKAPRCLSAATRALAARYLSGEIGRGMKPAEFAIAPDFFLQVPTGNQICAEAVRLIAASAPLRLLPGEKLAGAATLPEAMAHQVPLTTLGSVSHTTLGFEKALKLGLRGIRRDVEARLRSRHLDADARDLLTAMRVCLDAARVWHGRYVAALEPAMARARGAVRRQCEAILEALRPVPELPPKNFRQAIQALWLLWDFQRLCGNWSGLGRFDKMLGPFLARDLAAGRISLAEARELIAHFWIKGCEWITAEGRGTGDAQFYQNIVLAGVDERGRDVTNDVTYLVLDVVEELHISDFPIAVRLNRQSSERLVRRVAEVQRLGGGIVAIYNEDRIIPTLVKFGYPLGEARNFANDGCWEILIPGKTCFGYEPFDTLKLLQEALGLGAQKAATPDFPAFDDLYAAFLQRLARRLTEMIDASRSSKHPAPLIALLIEDCVGKGQGYYDLGPKYTVVSPHAGGLPDTVDSLLAIRRLVYEERKFSLREFVNILRQDWAGQENLRRRIRAVFPCFGNDDAEADAMMQRVFNDYTGLVGKAHERWGILRPAGISTFGREVSGFLPDRLAAASGRHKGDILAPNFSPSPGSDRHGPTAVIKSHCSVDFSRLPCGTVLDMKLLPATLQGEAGLRGLIGLLRTFVELGGIFMQIDAVDSAMLREAQEHPGKYPNLSVRVSGWSARFATLSKEWQDMIIGRTQQSLK